MKTVICLLIFFVSVIFLTASCTEQPKQVELEEVSIAFQLWVGYGPLYLAEEKGFFKKEGIRMVFVDEQLDSARRDAFKQGMLDCEAGTIDLLVEKRAQDTPIVAVMEIDHSTGSDGIVASADIKKVEDLIGKKVAFARGDVGETFISYLFHKRGLSLDDITIIPRRPEDAWQAFLSHKADAVVTWQPWLSKALQKQDGHILISTKDEPDIIIDVLNVREDLVKDNPQLIKKIMRGWFQALKYYKEHPLEASEIIAKYYDITPKQYREDVKGLKWDDYEHQLDIKEKEELFEVFDTISQIKFNTGRISKKPDAQKSINRELLESLYE